METPSGVAAVRGTDFVVQVSADGETTVITLDGLLDFFNNTGTIQVPQGFLARASSMDEAPTLQPVSDQELAGFAGLTDDDGFGDADLVDIEIPGLDGQGRPTTLHLRIPRDQLGGLLPGGLPQ